MWLMFTKLFMDALATFLHLTLKEKSVTRTKLKKLLNIFTKMWVSEMRKTKTNAREIKKK